MSTDTTVAVAGATGRLGALVEVLLARGHTVRALTREVDGPLARRLAQLGADVRHGDFDDPGSIARAAAGADALFATGTAHRAGPDGELRHGRAMAGAAAEAAVGHVVYVSGDGAAADSPLPLFRTKFAVEHHIASLGIPYTIFAPTYFMENLFNPWNLPALRSGVLPSPIAVDASLQQTAVADVIALAALAIEQPERFVGRRIRVASDELTAREAADAIAAELGVELEPRVVSADQLPAGLRALFGWLAAPGHDVEIGALHRELPEIEWHAYGHWVRAQRPRFRELCPVVKNLHPARRTEP
jgi:uncharacterized protein YbjT (DUF2867 family)